MFHNKKIHLLMISLTLILFFGCSREYEIPKRDFVLTSENPVEITDTEEIEEDIMTEEETDEDEIIFFRNEIEKGADDVSIFIYKGLRYLELKKHDEVFARIEIALGSKPSGHKQKEGDRKTPEGEYYICYINSESQFKYFLGISYPNEDDARIAYQEGRINEYEFTSIKNAINDKRTPNWYTDLGGEIGIHGGGVFSDWTWGCIAVTDDDIDYIKEYAGLGTSVTIFE